MHSARDLHGVQDNQFTGRRFAVPDAVMSRPVVVRGDMDERKPLFRPPLDDSK
jgi:hypothetical protein